MSANTMVTKLSFELCKKNRPSMRHKYQDTAYECSPEIHEFINRVDVEGGLPASYDSHPSIPTGRVRRPLSSPLIQKDLLLQTEEGILKSHGVDGFIWL